MSNEIVAAHRTEVGLLLLSLDCVSDNLDRVGLVLQHPQQVVRAARALIAQAPSREDASVAVVPDVIVRDFEAALMRADNVVDALAVAAWLRRLPATDAVGWMSFSWGGVLLRFKSEYEAALRQLGLRSDAVRLLSTQASTYADWHDAVESVEAQIEGSPASEWDRAQFREYRGDLGTGTPMSALLGWMRAESFLAVMATIVRELHPDELGIVEAWAKAVASVEMHLLESQISLAAVQQALQDYPPLSTNTVPALWALRGPALSGRP